jgi:hypothetical protein
VVTVQSETQTHRHTDKQTYRHTDKQTYRQTGSFCFQLRTHAETRVRPRSVHVGFVVDKVALGQVFMRVLRLSPVNFIPPVLHYLEK